MLADGVGGVVMRCPFWLMVICGVVCSAEVMASPFHAGIAKLAVPAAAAAVEAVVWYPTEAEESRWQAGPFDVAATLDAPMAAGRFPVVLVSHGRRGGSLNHRELAASLAREGFVVVAPTHVGDAAGKPLARSQAQVLMDRPQQASAALEALLHDDRFASRADPDRVGMIGYSAGGYTALVLAGAKPDFVLADRYCKTLSGTEDGACRAGGSASVSAELASWIAPTEPRLKALVLLDPLAIMFDAAALAPVGIPVLLYRPQDDSYMAAAGNALMLAHALPTAPQLAVVSGRHFVFVDPCPDTVAAEVPLVCRDQPGVDRVAIHRRLEREIATFLAATL
ncbi:alpha/beta hydrolase family protein [Insolitispirillum peregrinum]|uniref:alpha/beta hydrolase family protein n=1 Tax=Insolitispirillum peregrinum TaxID=80876 RepID=UPI00362370CF